MKSPSPANIYSLPQINSTPIHVNALPPKISLNNTKSITPLLQLGGKKSRSIKKKINHKKKNTRK